MNADRGPASYLTIRNVPADVAIALDQEKRRRGSSLNQTVIELLRQGLGAGTTRSNGLASLAGAWTADEVRRFEEAVEPFDGVDEEIWR